MAADIQGIIINEILPDPNGTNNFDTDGDGNFDANDEFVELYNTTGSPVDISGWTLNDGDGTDPDFTFPAGTTIPANGYVIVVGGWNNGPLPANVFELGNSPGVGTWNNSGDEIILSNADGSQTIVAVYNNENNGDIPAGAMVDDFGSDSDGQSIQRFQDRGDTFAVTTPTPLAQNECFVTGTLIATANGEVAVEDLKVGDVVQTAGGQLEAIKWIGRQTVKPENIQNPMRGYPILVKAGALGNSLPVRDLYVSPDHALWVEGLLINAGALVNSISIIQTEPADTFTYFHVELEKHALLIAEGTFAESYLPQREDRDCYDNTAEYSELYPEGPSVMLWPLDYPRVSSYTTVPRYVRKRLQAIADELYGAVAV